MPEEFLVGGAIETRWKVWGAAEGPFGKAVGPEEDVPGRNGRRQAFERGEIVWSADQEMVLSAFRLRDEVCFEFSKTRFTYDHYRMNYFFNGVPQGQNESTTSNSDGQSPTIIHWVGVQGYGEFAFHARGEDDDDDSAQGWAIPVRVRLDPVPGTPDPAWPPVTGVIAERWHELGAWDGPLGKPVGREDFNPDGGIRNQEFEYGRIFTAPELGPRMVVAGYQRGRSIELTWGGSDWGFNKMTVEVSHNGTVISQETIETGGVGSFHSLRWARPGDRGGRFRLDATQGDGLYTFNLYPRVSDAGPPIAHIPTIALWYERGPHDALIETLATDTTPALAFASHASRTTSVARHYVRTRPLRPSFTAATEDNSIQLIAHLHMASVDPAFCARGELPPRILASAALGSLNRGHGQVGTSFNEEFLGVKLRRDGDYDMALKGLMVIAYRYRALLTQEQVDFIVNVLVPSYLRGPHDPKLESYAILTENVPETENHMLMINSSRYLVNQLLHDRTGDPKYDNVGNGLMAWLLIYLNVISKHDFLEFNARPYQRLSLHVLFNLHEFARDNSVRTAAKILLDYTMVKFAVSSNRQRRISPFRRLKENTNSPTKINDMLRDGIGGDPVTGFFLSYTGPSGRDGKPARWFPDGWTFNALIAGPADYRPPPAAYILALTRFAPAQHVFNHGRRPQMPEADEDADGGVEIYHRSASFLLTAGGAWLNSGYGLDEFTGYKQVAIAQSTTLMFTRAFDVRVKPEDVDLRIELDTKFADLIRFDRWPSVDDDGEAVERDAVNTAVHTGFACGANLEVPDLWLQLGGATWDGPWLFLDLNRPSEALPEHLRPYGPLGAYVAIYRTTLGPADIELLESQYDAVPPKNVGFLYAMEADTVDPATGTAMTFAAFRDGIRARNATFSNPLDWAAFYVFHSPDNHKYDFWLRSDQHKYRPRVELDDQALPPGGFEALPLVSGPYLRTPGGHDGRFEVRHPGCDHPLVLDFSDQHNPVYLDNIAACPQPWLDRGYALLVFAQTLRNAGKPTEAAGAMVERVRVYQRMAEADRGTYLPRMAIALFELVLYHRAGLSPASALAFAHDGLTAYEELAGLREPGSQDPVDYDHLAAFTPNEHWIWPSLPGALYNLALLAREAGDDTAAADWTIKRIRVYQRLTQVDPATYRSYTAAALFELVLYHRAGLSPASALAFAHDGLTAYEELAGLREPGSQDPVDYDHLAAFTPNEHWIWPSLPGALYNLALLAREAGDDTAAADWTIKRIRVYQRLTQVDPATYRSYTAAALFELIFYHRAGLSPASALAFAHDGLTAYEELAGLREPGSQDPVDYDHLAAFTPNEYWGWHLLSGALWNLAWVLKEAGDTPAAAGWMVRRVRVYERLVQVDPLRWQPELTQAQADAAAFGT